MVMTTAPIIPMNMIVQMQELSADSILMTFQTLT